MADFNEAIKRTLVNEGGYVNDKSDRGSETNFGISKRAYPNEDIKNLTVDKAKAIYKHDYWDKVKGDNITSQAVAFDLFDTAVNMGVKTATKLAQMVIDTHPDGIVGVNTLNALNGIDEELFLSKFKLSKIARYAYLCKKRPENKRFLLGWINRSLA